MEITETTKFPLDFDSLQKGSVIAPSQIEEICGHPPGSKPFELCSLGLRSKIKDHFRRCGIIVYVKGEGDGLKILTDNEALLYVHDRSESTLQNYEQLRFVFQNIDRSNLSEVEKAFHDRGLQKMAFIKKGIDTGRKEFRQIEGRNKTPRPGLIQQKAPRWIKEGETGE